MNGHAADIVMWLIAGLVSLIEILIGAIVKMHMNSDKEHRDEMSEEIKILRTRMHDLGTRVGELVSKDYFESRPRR